MKRRNRHPSAKIHLARPRVKISNPSVAKKRSRKLFHATKRAVLVVIVLAMMAVILTVLFSNFASPERTIKRKIESIATDYYENYFYDSILSYGTTEQNLQNLLGRYVENGFAIVSLRQLLLFDSERHSESATILTAYCDENTTFIRIYPDPPFSRTNYHIDYHYNCNF